MIISKPAKVPSPGNIIKNVQGEYLLDSSLMLYGGIGTVEFTIGEMEIKSTVQEYVDLYVDDVGLTTDIYTERIHVCNVPGALIPPFRLVGAVPGTEYYIDQQGASATLHCQWTNVSTMLTTVALPYRKTAAYKATYDRIQSYYGGSR